MIMTRVESMNQFWVLSNRFLYCFYFCKQN